MAEEEEEASKVNHPSPDLTQPPLPFVEVFCKSSGKKRRFAAGTEARFALSLINRKLNSGSPLAVHIESVKEAEEPVNFGPNSVLVDYGEGWKMQTVTEVEAVRKEGVRIPPSTARSSSSAGLDHEHPAERALQPAISPVYIGKILLAFLLIFVLGAIFTLALENLPRLILYINSSM